MWHVSPQLREDVSEAEVDERDGNVDAAVKEVLGIVTDRHKVGVSSAGGSSDTDELREWDFVTRKDVEDDENEEDDDDDAAVVVVAEDKDGGFAATSEEADSMGCFFADALFVKQSSALFRIVEMVDDVVFSTTTSCENDASDTDLTFSSLHTFSFTFGD